MTYTLTVALPTFFHHNDDLDLVSYKKMIHYLDSDVDQFLIGGTTGEGLLLIPQEINHLIESALKITKKPLLACLIVMGRQKTIDYLHQLHQHKLTALVVIPGIYFRTQSDNILEMIGLIVQNTHLPLILYNNPARTGIDLKPLVIKAILQKYASRIIGWKESSGDLTRAEELSQLCTFYGVNFLSGNDSEIISNVTLGSSGAVSVLGNLCPKLVRAAAEETKNNNTTDECLVLFESTLKALEGFYNPQGIKVALNYLKIGPENYRAFLQKTDLQAREILYAAIEILKEKKWIVAP
jgi:4-hydroxy-tetrahydrodipicolinate synthase